MPKKRRHRKRRTLDATIAVTLGINAHLIDDDGRAFMQTIPLFQLPAWPVVWQIAILLHRLFRVLGPIVTITLLRPVNFLFHLPDRFDQLRERSYVPLQMLSIGLKSSLWGLGVNV